MPAKFEVHVDTCTHAQNRALRITPQVENYSKLGECRTLWASVSKQYIALTYISKIFSEVSDHSTQVAWHVAEQSLLLYKSA